MSILSKLFGGSSEKRDQSYTGPQPYAHLYDAPGGSDALAEFRKRLAGQSVGYGDAYANQVSNPIIAAMRNRYQSQVYPELVSELSATGRRRGSGGFEQLRRSLTDQAFAEGDVFANLYRENEQQKRSEINDALSGLERFGMNEVGVQGDYVAAQKADHDAQLAREDARRTAKGAENMRALQAGSDLLGNIVSGGFGQFGGGGGQQMFNYGGQQYAVTPPPYGYDYSNLNTPKNTRSALKASLYGGYR